MRLLIVTESFLPRVDGVSRSVSALIRHCRSHGHEALVVAPGHGPHEADGFPVVRVMGVPALYPGLVVAPMAPGLRRLIARFAPDIVHLASPAVLGATAARAARRAGVPVVAHFQTDVAAYAGHYGRGVAAPLVRGWLRRLHNRCDATYAPTEVIAAGLRARGVLRVGVSGRGVDTSLFRPDRPGAGAAAARWAPGGTRVLCVSRLAAEKGLERLVDLARGEPRLSILLVGPGPLERELRRRAPANLRLAGLLEGEDLADVYAAAEIFAFPSRTETFGQVVQEAMASGLPVVGMRSGGVAELVADGRTGLLADPDGDGFERVLLSLATDPGLAARLGAAGPPAMAGRSWDAVLTPLLGEYARLRPGRPRRPSDAGRPRPREGRAAAFLDVDRTVLSGSSFLALAGPAARAGLLRRRTMLRAAAGQLRFAAFGASEARIARSAAGAARVLAGVDAERLRGVGRAAVPTHIAPRIFPAARRVIAEHRARGDAVFLVSSAPEEVVAAIAGLVGADGFAASRAEIVDGRYTGRLLRLCQGREKVVALAELASRHRLDLRRSTAYGDSAADAAMLAAVGRGVCVNPDRMLRGIARLRGWEVRRFRLQPRELGHPDRLAPASVTVA